MVVGSVSTEHRHRYPVDGELTDQSERLLWNAGGEAATNPLGWLMSGSEFAAAAGENVIRAGQAAC